ncbi:Pentatricopeptide repeat [Macleaya cordata]|uniref:Pentatricopeptide repeat n=1 Tax=Macleaya cordata TaxID=56857 RepID=A0A200QRC3_MACCD|nr:Pentatricopeptide repeat [Macleaya cordata]
MDAIVVSLCFSQTSLTNSFYKTLIINKPPPTKNQNLLCFSSLSSSPKPYIKPHYHHHETPQKDSTKPKTLLVETLHETRRLRELVNKLNKEDSNPLEILRDEGDWSKDQFWTVTRFLKETSRSKEVLQVFDLWKNLEKTRINEVNYEKIILLLGEVGLMEEAVSSLQEMKVHGLSGSLKVYNSIVLGFARKGEFENALIFLKEMVETNLKPETETYNGLIQSCGNYQMYDEMGKCMKRMESEGCLPNSITYNLLIVEFARGGLLKRMERAYRTLLSKRMDLQSSTLIAMLEAYTDLGILEEMEKVYRRVLNTRISLSESLIRKIAGFYIENFMFSRLDDLGIDIASRYSKMDLVWCIRLLSPACLLSKKGMDSIVREMEVAKFPWNITIMNVMALAYLKMKDLKQLDILLSQFQTRDVKPDIVTVGVLFDASNATGFNGSRTLEVWRRIGLLEEAVEMKTDTLVFTAFGKGHFLKTCEEMYSSIEPEVREKRVWTYRDFIDLVFKHK